jgi:hypothetical protein
MDLKKIFQSSGLLVCILSWASILVSCDIKDSDADPSESFSAVYDHPDMNLAFYPVDMVQTTDDGYLILSVYTDTTLSTFPLIRLMKTDKAGIFAGETIVDPSYCSAVPGFARSGSSWQFACMDAINQNVKLLQVDEDLSDLKEVAELEGKYPLYLYPEASGSILILTFNRIARTSVLTCYSADLFQQWQSSFNINEDYKNQIETHLKKGGRQFPFFITGSEESDNKHFLVNCFYNYTMTMLFTRASDGIPTGQLNTYQDDAAISSVVSLDNNYFAVSRYYMGSSYIYSSVMLDMNDTQGANTFEDTYMPELTFNAAVKSLATRLDERDVIIFASQTKANNLVMYIFDKVNGELITTKYLGSTNPVTIAGIIPTRDGGLALLAQTYAAGRFPRVSVFKIASKEFQFE